MLFFTGILMAGKTDVKGSWIVTKVEKGDNISYPYQSLSFMPDGTLKIMEIPVGTWEVKGKKLFLKTDVFEKKNESYEVSKEGKSNLILSNKEQTMYLQKMDAKMVAENNKKSGLEGKWKMNGDYPEMIRIFDFVLPDSLAIVENEPGVTSSYKGMWVYDPKDNSLILMVMGTEIRGKYQVKKEGDNLLLSNDELTLKGSVVKPSTNKIEHLDFTEEDFYDANGDYKYYDDEEKLPWQDPYSILESLRNIHELDYKYADYLLEVNVPKEKILTADVNYDEGAGKVCMDDVFRGYDKNSLPEDTELPRVCYTEDSYNHLFPYKGDTYRIARKEQITTPAGTFDCTVVDVAGDFDAVARLWLVDNKPGIIAKIIQEKKDSFGYFRVFELEKIK